jgi:hypothetical protein
LSQADATHATMAPAYDTRGPTDRGWGSLGSPLCPVGRCVNLRFRPSRGNAGVSTPIRRHNDWVADIERLVPFWRWAYGDLLSNATRGVFAEWLVAQALDVDVDRPRVEWDNYDLRTRNGWRVEVKCGGFLQAWQQHKPSNVVYAGLSGREWRSEHGGGAYSLDRRVRADVFVFALQTCTDPEEYDALDLTQWEFRLASGADVASWRQRSITLSSLGRKGLSAVAYAGLAAAFESMVAALPEPTGC